MRDLVFIKFNSKLNQKRGMKNRDPIEDHTFVDVVEDEDNIPDYPGNGLIQYEVKNTNLHELSHRAVSLYYTFCYTQ